MRVLDVGCGPVGILDPLSEQVGATGEVVGIDSNPRMIAHMLKGTTARKVFQRFPDVKKQLWGGAFWSRSYDVGSVGDMGVDVVLK